MSLTAHHFLEGHTHKCIPFPFPYSAILHTGTYLALGTSSVSVHVVKEWAELGWDAEVKAAHTKAVTALAWAPKAAYLASSSADRSVKIFSKSA